MSAHPPYLWVLNPDAERELSSTHSYAVRAASMQRVEERRALFDGLVQGDAMEFSHALSIREQPTRALFWCPTPRVLAAASQCGLLVGPAPTISVLRAVHDKRFISTALAELTLLSRHIVSTEEQWKTLRATTKGPLRLKRPFGYAGKGQRIWPEQGGEDRPWLADSLRLGGFVAEPHVTGALELSQHGYFDARGLLLGQPCWLKTDKSSAPVSIEPALHVDRAIREQLKSIAEKAAHALGAAGYFGPFGIDALIVEGQAHLIDLNPRFTLGWSIGMGALRAEAIERALA